MRRLAAAPWKETIGGPGGDQEKIAANIEIHRNKGRRGAINLPVLSKEDTRSLVKGLS